MAVTAEVLAQLLDRHAAALELYARQWTNSPADVVQEAFLELIRARETPRRAVAWLYRVVRLRALNAQRAAGRRRHHEQRAAELMPLVFVPSPDRQLNEQSAAEALAGLPLEQREVVVARIWGGLTLQEIAEVADVSISTVHRRYERALATLREKLDVPWLKNDCH